MNSVSKLALLAVVAGLTACSDNSTAPQQVSAPAVATSGIHGSMQDLSSTDTTRFSITIDPSTTTTYYLGSGNTLYFPAGSLCETGWPTGWTCSVADRNHGRWRAV